MYEESIECFDKIIELNPTYEMAWYYKGRIYSDLGRYGEEKECYDKTIECLDKAIELNPYNIEVWRYKASYLYQFGRYDKAAECYDKLIELNPSEKSWYEDMKIECLAEQNSYDFYGIY